MQFRITCQSNKRFWHAATTCTVFSLITGLTLLISDPLFIVSQTRNIANFKLKSLRLNLVVWRETTKTFKDFSIPQIKLYQGVRECELPIPFIRYVTNGCLPVGAPTNSPL